MSKLSILDKWKEKRRIKAAQAYYENAYPQGPQFDNCKWCGKEIWYRYHHKGSGDMPFSDPEGLFYCASTKDPRYHHICLTHYKPEYEAKRDEEVTTLAAQVAGGLYAERNLRGIPMTDSDIAKRARAIATEIYNKRHG